jgi:hypothetical protein
VAICSTAFEGLGRAQAGALGEPALPILAIPHPFGTRTPRELDAIADACISDLLVRIRSDAAGAPCRDAIVGAVARPPAAVRRIRFDGDDAALQDFCLANGWGDGLPVMAPTDAAVARMLAGTHRATGDEIARVAPGFGAAIVEAVAVNAVLAGCAPAYLPVVLAAVEAMTDDAFNLQAVQATTNPAAVWVIVNGPIATRLGINGGANCLGPGARANATIGRAIRLVLQNIGGARGGDMDRATHGQPGKYTFCCAENAADSPWPPLHTERGLTPDTSAVTVVAAEGTMNMNSHAKDATELLRVFADTIVHPASNEYTHGGEPWLLLSPEHARVLSQAGLDKDAVRSRLWEATRMPAGRMSAPDRARAAISRKDELGAIGPDTLLPIARAAADIRLLVAGGPGTHSVYVPGFGNSRAVTRRIDA